VKLDDRQVATLLTAIGDDALDDDGRDDVALASIFDRVRTAALAARHAGRPPATEPTNLSPIAQAIDIYRHQVDALDAAVPRPTTER